MQKKIIGSLLSFYSCLCLAHPEPKYSLFDSSIVRTYPDGTKSKPLDARKYAIVKRSNMGQAYKPRCPQCKPKIVYKWKEKEVFIETQKYKNTLWLIPGFGPNGTRPLEVTQNEVIIGSNFLPLFTLGYSRCIHERVDLMLIGTSNWHGGIGIGLKF